MGTATVGAAFGLRDGRARTAREAPNHFLSVSSASTTARGATTRTEVIRAGSNMGPGGQGEGGAQWAWTCRKPTGVAMRVGFGICKVCGDAGRLKYGARRSRVMRSGSNMGPGGQGEGGAQWAWTCRKPT